MWAYESVFYQIYRGNQSDEEMYKMISDTLTVIQMNRDEGKEA